MSFKFQELLEEASVAVPKDMLGDELDQELRIVRRRRGAQWPVPRAGTEDGRTVRLNAVGYRAIVTLTGKEVVDAHGYVLGRDELLCALRHVTEVPRPQGVVVPTAVGPVDHGAICRLHPAGVQQAQALLFEPVEVLAGSPDLRDVGGKQGSEILPRVDDTKLRPRH